MTAEQSCQHIECTDIFEIKEHIENVIAEEHGEAVFKCKVDGLPQPTCAWYKDGKLITSSQRRKITSESKWHQLKIRKVSVADHGVYTIVCQNSSKQLFSKANLYVINRNLHNGVFYTHTNSKCVSVVKHLRNVKVKKGDLIELEAKFQHDDNVINFIWLKDNEVVKQGQRIIILSSKKYTNLSLLKCKLADSGIYYVVAKTIHGIVSSYAEVQVTALEESANEDELLPLIEEHIPEEAETNENEDIRLICKANFDINTSILWYKNGIILEENSFTVEDYGDHYIGLRGVKVSRIAAGVYTVTLRDENTGKEDTSNCILTVNPAPMKTPPIVELERPLESAVARWGSKVTFDCSFSLEDPKYFYVVWYVGPHRVERSNSRFSVVYNGGVFLLYIKSVEHDMCGQVVCELRKALPNQKTVHVSYSTAHLTIVPECILQEEKKSNSSGKLYNDNFFPCEYVEVADGRNTLNFDTLPERSTNGNGNGSATDVILEITFCRLDEDGNFFLHSSKGHSEVVVSRLTAYYKPRSTSNTVVIEWKNSAVPASCWYYIELGQSDGRYVEAGVSSVPSFETQDPPVDHLMRFRVKTVPRPNDATESSLRIVPTPDAVLKPPKSHNLRPMEEFVQDYTLTGDLIGSGSFGQVVVVRDGTGEFYAAKVLKFLTQRSRDTGMREFEIMKQLRHPKIVQLMDAFVAADAFVLVMDYLWGGELFDRIVKEGQIKEVDVVLYVRQICEALQYLHTYKIAHLDLKPENIICVSPNSGQVKIIDFGIAKVLEEGLITRCIYGSRDYIAPEVLNYERLTVACDMWSLGVLTYVLLSGVMPFAGDSWLQVSANITSANYNYDEIAFREISDLAKEFVDQLLVLNTDRRMSAAAALDHKWIKEGPPKSVKTGYMNRTRENLKSYLANYRAKWQRAGNVMIAAHRLRTRVNSARASAEIDPATCVT